MPGGNGGVIGQLVIPTTAAASGVWRPSYVANHLRRAANTAPVANWPTLADSSFASVSGLYHCQESVIVGTQAFLKDSSSNGVHLTYAQADAVAAVSSFGPSTAQSKFDGSSFLANTAHTSTNTATKTSAGFAFGTGDFTIEAWIYLTATGTDVAVIDFRTSRVTTTGPELYVSSGGALGALNAGVGITGAGSSFSANAWHHIAWSRVSGSNYLYLDGAQQGSTLADSTNFTSNVFHMGGCVGSTAANNWPGYLQDVRITKGVGRYSGSTCAVPTAPFPDY